MTGVLKVWNETTQAYEPVAIGHVERTSSSVRVHNKAGGTIAASTWVDATFTGADHDSDGMWDGAKLMTAQHDGYHLITFSAASNVTGERRIVKMSISGGGSNYGRSDFESTRNSPRIAEVVWLVAGQTVGFGIWASTGNFAEVADNGEICYAASLTLLGGFKGDKGDAGNLPHNIVGVSQRSASFALADGWNDVPMDTSVVADGVSAVDGWLVVPEDGYYVAMGYAVGTFATYHSVRVTADGQQLSGAFTDWNSASAVARIRCVTDAEWLTAGSVLKLSVGATNGESLTEGRLSVHLVGGPKGADGAPGEKGDAGNLPHNSGFEGFASNFTPAKDTPHTIVNWQDGKYGGWGASGNDGITEAAGEFAVTHAGWYSAYLGADIAAGAAITNLVFIEHNRSGSWANVAQQGNDGTGFRRLMVGASFWLEAGDKVRFRAYSSGPYAFSGVRAGIALVGGPKGDKGDPGADGPAGDPSSVMNEGIDFGYSLAGQSIGGSHTYVAVDLANFTPIKQAGDITYDPVGDTVTIAKAGFYLQWANAKWDGDAATEYNITDFYVNGNHRGRTSARDSNTAHAVDKYVGWGNGVWLDAGDVVHWKVMGGVNADTVRFYGIGIALVGGPKGDKGDTGNLPDERGVAVWALGEQSSGVNNGTIIAFDTLLDHTGGADAWFQNGGIVVPEAGWYDCAAYGYGSTTGDFYLRILVDGGGKGTQQSAGASRYARTVVSEPLYLEAGEKVTAAVYSGASVSTVGFRLAVVKMGGPKGDKGDKGDTGAAGVDGTAAPHDHSGDTLRPASLEVTQWPGNCRFWLQLTTEVAMAAGQGLYMPISTYGVDGGPTEYSRYFAYASGGLIIKRTGLYFAAFSLAFINGDTKTNARFHVGGSNLNFAYIQMKGPEGYAHWSGGWPMWLEQDDHLALYVDNPATAGTLRGPFCYWFAAPMFG